ncbi:hypothetical protein ACFL6C_03175 [Myxococcota bacterium]
MTEIGKLPGGLPIDPNVTMANQEVSETRVPTTAIKDATQPSATSQAKEVASTLPPPGIPLESFSAAQVAGADSFANNLRTIVPSGSTSNDVTLAFLKLQLLEETNDQMAKNLLNTGKLTLRNVTHGDEGVMGALTNQVRAGTEGLNAALKTTDQLQQQRNQLIALLAGIRPDVELRADSLVDVDKLRNQIADLVMELIDKYVEANEGSQRDIRS